MKKLMILLLVFLLAACQNGGETNKQQGLSAEKTESDFSGKKVTMVIIDTMIGSLVDSAREENSMPALQFLLNEGQYYKDLVSPFPTMSVTIESTLLTGEMPDKHKVPGLFWYDEKEDRLVNYGSSTTTLLSIGLKESLYNALYNLNNKHLSPDTKTIFEELSEKNLTSGAINTVIYRGSETHELKFPGILNELVRLPDTIETKGPDVLAFGRMTAPESLQGEDFPDGIFNLYGLTDEYSMEVMKALAEKGEQPDFTLIFFPDFDKEAHRKSPHYRAGFEKTDEYLQGILNAYDSWEAALEENIFIIIGDHGQDKLAANEEELVIDIQELYSGYTHASLGAPVSEGEIGFGINQRMAYVYDPHKRGLLQELAERAMQDDRVAFAAWLTGDEQDWVKVISPGHPGSLQFKKEGSWTDKYGQSWTLEGEQEILALKKDNAAKKISYSDYPDVLNQLYSALHSHDPEKIILAAKPGYTFWGDTLPVYDDGGEHGGIHKNDSLAAMVIAGTDKKPEHLRIVDLKDYVLELLEENPEPLPVKKQSAKSKENKAVNHGIARQANELVKSFDGVTDAVTVVFGHDIYTAYKVSRFNRFRLDYYEERASETLEKRFKDHRSHVSSDQKVFMELEQLSNELKSKKMKEETVKKRLTKIQEDMKG